MKIKISFLIISILLLALSQTIASQERDSLLSDEDMVLEQSEKGKVPALSSPLDAQFRWESFNQWMCFDNEAVDLVPVEIESGGRISSIPLIYISDLGRNFEVSIFGESDEENEAIFDKWRALLKGAHRICVYAAYLRNNSSEDPTPSSTWIIAKLKTENGYWSYVGSEEEQFVEF